MCDGLASHANGELAVGTFGRGVDLSSHLMLSVAGFQEIPSLMSIPDLQVENDGVDGSF